MKGFVKATVDSSKYKGASYCKVVSLLVILISHLKGAKIYTSLILKRLLWTSNSDLHDLLLESKNVWVCFTEVVKFSPVPYLQMQYAKFFALPISG